ncbi:MAG TPA: glutamate racemase [Coxiellaceae bacterium]|nr:glutamate racemase [Coxiellaceae bacterium]
MLIGNARPIGIFDSGIGGLTIAQAVTTLLPHENIIYFGDTAHVPYGDKSTSTIQSYCLKICDVLLEEGCKLILVACNSASAAAFDLMKSHIGSRAAILSVIDPMVEYLGQYYANKTVGLIGTRQTVNSLVYNQKINELNRHIHLKTLATPLLVPLIEEGLHQSNIMQELVCHYLSQKTLAGIDALILGCTHYPLVRSYIDQFYQGRVEVIDSPQIMACALQEFLQTHHLANPESRRQMRFYLSDYTEAFQQAAKLFFGEEIIFEHYSFTD